MGPRKNKFIQKHRGYYSESILDPSLANNDDDNLPLPAVDEMLAWRMKAYQPHLFCHNLPTTERSAHLQSAQRWIQYKTVLNFQFPASAIEPKVQLKKDVPAGCLPRAVEIERRLRKNALTNIEDELAKAKISLAHLIPVHKLREHLTTEEKSNNFSKTVSRLPLEWFDNYDFDSRTPEDWLSIGVVDGVQHPIPAKAFLPVTSGVWENESHFGVSTSRRSTVTSQAAHSERPSVVLTDLRNSFYHWQVVAVTDYDPEKYRWLVTDLDNKINYLIPRIYLIFMAEDARHFCERLQHALTARAKGEAYLKFMFVIDNMVLTGIPKPRDQLMARILSNLTTTTNTKTEWIRDLVNEVQMGYQKVLCVIETKKIFENDREQYADIDLPEVERKSKAKPLVNSGMVNFDEIKSFYRRHTLFCMGSTIRAMEGIIVECTKVSEMSLFTDFIDKSTLDNFDRVQVRITSHTMDYLNNRFLESCARAIMLKLYNIGKGWFDMHVASWELYLMSKMNRFVGLVRVRMELALRFLGKRSVRMFCALLCQPCECLVHVPADLRWGKDLRSSPFVPKRQPVFQLELEMNESGAFYSTPPGDFLPVILRLYDDALRQTHFVPILDPTLMSSLLYPDHLYLSSLGLHDEFVQAHRDLLQLSYQKAVIALSAYASQYDMHISLFVTNTNDFVASVRDENRTSQNIKEEISFQLKMKDNLQVTLPSSIIIGPFFINVDPLKQFLINKRRDIADKLLKMLAERLHGKTKSICEQYRQINNRLSEKPRSVEHIHQVREWIETIPEAIRALEEMMRTTLFEYEILDHFWFAVSNEQFYTKWEAIAWPQKVFNQIHATQIAHVEYTEKFQKQQAADVATLGERCEELNAQITGYTLEFDVERVHELAVEMRRLWKSLKELQSFIDLLNVRQALFELPSIESNEVQTMTENFKPYHDLWTTGSDSIKARELWCGNPMFSINMVTITTTLNDHKSKLTALLETFAEMSEVLAVNQTFLDRVGECEPLIVILAALKNPDWTHPHWSELAQRSEMPIKYSESINLQYLIDYGIAKHKDLVEEISAQATEQKEELEALAREAAEVERLLMIEKDRKRQRRLLRTDI